MSLRPYNPHAPQVPLPDSRITELKNYAARMNHRHYVDLDMESVLDGEPIVQVRCKECDLFVLDCTCNQDSLSDDELDELLADSSTPNLAALYAMAKEK